MQGTKHNIKCVFFNGLKGSLIFPKISQMELKRNRQTPESFTVVKAINISYFPLKYYHQSSNPKKYSIHQYIKKCSAIKLYFRYYICIWSLEQDLSYFEKFYNLGCNREFPQIDVENKKNS